MTRGTPVMGQIPSLDRLLRSGEAGSLVERYGRDLTTSVLRECVDALRQRLLVLDDDGGSPSAGDTSAASLQHEVLARCEASLAALHAPGLRKVLNLTGTVLHTNLGRAPLPAEAVQAMCQVAEGACNLEMDLAAGRRGDRDDHVVAWICRLTGAEAATVVNNNAAAVLLVLNALAAGREVPVSRGELIEIGGSFRVPDIMARAGCTLVEVGTTNRTHPRDFEDAVGADTALLMKVHTSNYEVQGFTASVDEKGLADIAHAHGLPMVSDLGSGTLVDMARYGLPHETTPAETLAAGADLVTFSGDKLLGGPQCGIIAGRRELVDRVKKNPMKRSMRVDKMTLAALQAVLPMFADPERLPQRLPALRLLTRGREDIETMAEGLLPAVREALCGRARVDVVPCASQIGSGALPVDSLDSAALRLQAEGGSGRALNRLAAELRALPVPVLGRLEDGGVLLDLRCLEEPGPLLRSLAALEPLPGE
jgi:L-seryl-tRNA(Ser) seleniumtransferase